MDVKTDFLVYAAKLHTPENRKCSNSKKVCMHYQHEFTLQATLEDVMDFHARSSSMAAITPPPIIVRIHEAPEILENQDHMRFTLWLGPLPLHWMAQIETDSPRASSTARSQVRSSFGSTATASQRSKAAASVVKDDVTARLKRNPVWWLAGAGMWLGMPILFAYRGWKTSKIVRRRSQASGTTHANPPL